VRSSKSPPRFTSSAAMFSNSWFGGTLTSSWMHLESRSRNSFDFGRRIPAAGRASRSMPPLAALENHTAALRDFEKAPLLVPDSTFALVSAGREPGELRKRAADVGPGARNRAAECRGRQSTRTAAGLEKQPARSVGVFPEGAGRATRSQWCNQQPGCGLHADAGETMRSRRFVTASRLHPSRRHSASTWHAGMWPPANPSRREILETSVRRHPFGDIRSEISAAVRPTTRPVSLSPWGTCPLRTAIPHRPASGTRRPRCR
jgi:hypothetical protein